MHARAEEAVLARAARSTALPGDPGLWVFILPLYLAPVLAMLGAVELTRRSQLRQAPKLAN